MECSGGPSSSAFVCPSSLFSLSRFLGKTLAKPAVENTRQIKNSHGGKFTPESNRAQRHARPPSSSQDACDACTARVRGRPPARARARTVPSRSFDLKYRQHACSIYRADTLPGGGLLGNSVFSFSPRVCRFTGLTTHRWKQEKIPHRVSFVEFEFRA